MNEPMPLHPVVAESLSLAIVESSNGPLLLMDAELRIIAASRAFCRDFGMDRSDVVGCKLTELGEGEWTVPQLKALLLATASGAAEVDAYRMDFQPFGQSLRCLILNARKLDYSDAANVRVVLTIADVTEIRAAEKQKDDLLREKAILLQEIQHRVANSLQIIASVLLQSARKVKSDESRLHLEDAHSRVMSIATLQQQLAASNMGDVALRPYFNDLCRSIGASMIRDHDQLTLTVDAQDSSVPANVSVSLGLIVTELVINALKHAFPDSRKGAITVGYETSGPGWALCISDDGVGMPADPGDATAGLGTSIVQALAKQLEATVLVEDAQPGTKVTISHDRNNHGAGVTAV